MTAMPRRSARGLSGSPAQRGGAVEACDETTSSLSIGACSGRGSGGGSRDVLVAARALWRVERKRERECVCVCVCVCVCENKREAGEREGREREKERERERAREAERGREREKGKKEHKGRMCVLVIARLYTRLGLSSSTYRCNSWATPSVSYGLTITAPRVARKACAQPANSE